MSSTDSPAVAGAAAGASSSYVPAPSASKLSYELEAETFKRLHPQAYLERFVSEGIRDDGRGFDQFRSVGVNVGSISTALGSALVRLGETTVVCGIKAETAVPDLAAPNEGWVVPGIELSPICSSKFKPGPPPDEAQVLTDRLNAFLTSSNILPPSALCIEPHKSAWVLYVDVVCINYDGNIFDAAAASIVAALRNAQLPLARYDDESARTLCSTTESAPLPLTCTPIPTSFGIFQSLHLLSDPSSFESSLMSAHVTVALDERGRISYLWQAGRCRAGDLSDEQVLREALRRSKARSEEVRKALEGSA